jgi:hypothetical protein
MIHNPKRSPKSLPTQINFRRLFVKPSVICQSRGSLSSKVPKGTTCMISIAPPSTGICGVLPPNFSTRSDRVQLKQSMVMLEDGLCWLDGSKYRGAVLR